MAEYISLNTLAKKLTNDLNTISAELYASSSINRSIPFIISADIDDYNKTDENKKYSSTVKVQGLMSQIGGAISPSQVFEAYNDVVLVPIYGYRKELKDMKKVIDLYLQRNTGKFTKSNDWIYQQEFQRPQVIDRGKDNGEKRVTILLEITYKFIFKGYTSDDITIKINGEEIPVLSYTHSNERSGVNNDNLTDAGNLKARNRRSDVTKVIRFVDIDNTEINKVFEDIDKGNYNGDYNNTYTVFYGKGYDADLDTYKYSNTETMIITSGQIQFTQENFQTVEVTLAVYNDLS